MQERTISFSLISRCVGGVSSFLFSFDLLFTVGQFADPSFLSTAGSSSSLPLTLFYPPLRHEDDAFFPTDWRNHFNYLYFSLLLSLLDVFAGDRTGGIRALVPSFSSAKIRRWKRSFSLSPPRRSFSSFRRREVMPAFNCRPFLDRDDRGGDGEAARPPSFPPNLSLLPREMQPSVRRDRYPKVRPSLGG